MTDLTVSDVLRKAIDVLEERGWHQGGIEGPNGELCAYGAILTVVREKGNPAFPLSLDGPVRVFKNWLQAEGLLHPSLGVGVWNDDPARTYEDVVVALKLAAYEAEEAQR